MTGEFREFDYGRGLNLEKYGTPVPPHYNLTKITTPVYLYYSTNDYLSHNQVNYEYFEFLVILRYATSRDIRVKRIVRLGP